MAENIGILVYCESADGKLAPMAMELLGAGSRLAQSLGQEVSAVLLGNKIAGLAQEVIAYGANKVYLADDPVLENYLIEPYCKIIVNLIEKVQPEIVLLGHTQMGRDLAPGLAFKLKTGASMDCVNLYIDPVSRRLQMVRPVYGGNARMTQVCQTDPQIATIRIKAFAPLV